MFSTNFNRVLLFNSEKIIFKIKINNNLSENHFNRNKNISCCIILLLQKQWHKAQLLDF